MSQTCQCGRPVADAYVCSDCSGRLARDLGDVPAIADELELVLGRQTVYGDRAGSRSAERPLPVDLRASETGWVLRNTLSTWARVVADERGLDLPCEPMYLPRQWPEDAPLARVNRCDVTDLPADQCAHCREDLT